MAEFTHTEPQTVTEETAQPVNSSTSNEKANEKVAHASGDVEITPDVDNGQIIDESDYTEAQYRKLTWKIDRYVLPLMFYCYAIQQSDKTMISIQALFDFEKDTGMKGQDYQWLTTIFYLTYMVAELPSNFLLQRFQIGRCLSFYMLGWGICVICISAAQTWSQLMALRALQGMFECAISPGFLFVTGQWYRSEEHATRSLLWISSEYVLSSILQLMIYGIAKHVSAVGGLAPWRSVSLFLGSMTIAGSGLCFFFLGTPSEVRWLSKDEKRMAISRIAKNKSGHDTTGTKWSWPQVIEAFKDPQLWFSFVNAFLNNIPNGGITTFSTLMYESFGFDEWQTILYSLPRYAVGFVLFLAVAFYLRRFKNQRFWVMILSCIISFIGLLVMSVLPNGPEYKWIKWGMYMMTVVFAFAIFIAWSLIPSNVAGGTKKTIISSMTFVGYCVGNMVGSQVFKTKDAPRYVSGTVACCACLLIEAVLLLLWRFWYMYENRRRDRLAAESGISKEDQERLGREMGEQELTDWQNPHFRYTM